METRIFEEENTSLHFYVNEHIDILSGSCEERQMNFVLEAFRVVDYCSILLDIA